MESYKLLVFSDLFVVYAQGMVLYSIRAELRG